MVYRRSGGGGGGGGGGGPAPFLVKTYEMVEEAGTDEVVSWGEKGASFVVWKPAEFASDLLPLHFKHNNFSSFVRQLNTYGFRKVVPDRWEFTNDNFRRGERRLLCKIRRRKPPAPTSRLQPSNDKPSARRNTQLIPPSSASNSGDMHSSSSASSPLLPLPCLPSNQLLELANENEKLRKDNHVLNTELAQAKCHFQELLGFLSKYVDVSQLNLSLLMGTEAGGETGKKEGVEEESAQGKEQGIKLFGVLLKGFEGEEREKTGGTKRQRCEGSSDGCGHGERPLTMSFALPWMGISTPLQQGSSRVDCN